MEATAQSIRFTLTNGDLFRMQLRAVLRNRIVWVKYPVFLGLVVNGLLSAPGVQERPLAFQIIFACFGAAFFTVPFCSRQLLVIANAVFWKKHQGVVGERAIKLPSEGLVENTTLNSGVHKWVGIHRVERNPR